MLACTLRLVCWMVRILHVQNLAVADLKRLAEEHYQVQMEEPNCKFIT